MRWKVSRSRTSPKINRQSIFSIKKTKTQNLFSYLSNYPVWQKYTIILLKDAMQKKFHCQNIPIMFVIKTCKNTCLVLVILIIALLFANMNFIEMCTSFINIKLYIVVNY